MTTNIDVNASDNGNDQPLNLAALTGKVTCCDPHVKGDNGSSLLHRACACQSCSNLD